MGSTPDAMRAAEVEGELVRAGLARVVDPSSAEDAALWAACDLASMVEGCFSAGIDPWALGERERQRWLDRLGESYEPPDPALDRSFPALPLAARRGRAGRHHRHARVRRRPHRSTALVALRAARAPRARAGLARAPSDPRGCAARSLPRDPPRHALGVAAQRPLTSSSGCG
ncbi:MAG: hypothetical protein M5U28_04735 [Sandaracinaceae bacterium]|nr:hypothetical protein [Sandaracinaceae bacterium]